MRWNRPIRLALFPIVCAASSLIVISGCEDETKKAPTTIQMDEQAKKEKAASMEAMKKWESEQKAAKKPTGMTPKK